MQEQLNKLIKNWENIAKFAFLSAKRQTGSFDKRFIEHGAMCYINCASELKQALSAFPPQLLTNQEGDQV